MYLCNLNYYANKMKKIAIIVMLVVAVVAQAQHKSTIETRALMNEYTRTKSVEKMPKQLTNHLSIQSTQEGVMVGVLAKVSPSFNKVAFEKSGIKVTSRVADIVALRVPLHLLGSLESNPDIVVYSVAHKVAPMCDDTRFDTRTDSVQAGLGVPMAFNGEGVLVGITDWGFDYQHPNINRSSEPRILRAWDHYRTAGPAPEGFDYGTELTTYEQLYEAVGDTFGLYGYGSHGTHVAGIIGGVGTRPSSSGANKFVGQAPKVQYLLGSWRLDEAGWMDQVVWMRNVAAQEGKRLVINSSWGMYTFSTLDGTSLLSQAVNHWSDSGTVFVTSGGNNGNDYYHLKRVFQSDTDTLYSVATYYGSGVGQALIYWGEVGQSFGAGFYITVGDSVVYRSPIFNTNDGDLYETGTFEANGQTLGWNIMVEQSNPLCQRPHVLLNVDKGNGIRLHMLAQGPQGNTVNVWNVCNLENHAGNIGCEFSQSGFFAHYNGDNNYGIGEPACAEKCITVAAHSHDRISNGTYKPGNLTSFSSHGPTLDGRNKPEISAPGYQVASSVNHQDHSYDNPQGGHAAAISVDGTRFTWERMSGTSMSGPAVTGVVALMLQANPNLTVDQIRDIIFTTARNDSETGPLVANDSMSLVWGWGKIDAVRCVNAAYDLLSIEEAQQVEVKLLSYPNPATHSVTILTGTNLPCQIEVYSLDGRLVASTKAETAATFDVEQWSRGTYIVRCQSRTGVRIAKIVKQ